MTKVVHRSSVISR